MIQGEGGGVPQLTDRSIHVDPEINGDAVEQAEVGYAILFRL